MNEKLAAKSNSERTNEDIVSLVARTDKTDPKPEDLQELKQFFDEFPGIALKIGNIRRHIFDQILDAATWKSAYMREAAERHIRKMKLEMGYNNSSFVEKLLIEEIILRWLRLQVVEWMHHNSTTGSHDMDEGIYCEKRLHLTQKRYLTAIESLAKVRKMIAHTQAYGARMFKDLVDAKS